MNGDDRWAKYGAKRAASSPGDRWKRYAAPGSGASASEDETEADDVTALQHELRKGSRGRLEAGTGSKEREARTLPLREELLDPVRQTGRGLADSGYATAIGLSEIAGADEAADKLREGREEAREFYGEAQTGAGKVAGVGARLTGDVAQFAVPGAAVSRAAQAAARGAKALGSVDTARRLARVAQPITKRGVIAKDVAAGVPVDAAIAAAGAEESTIGGVAALTGSERLQRFAEEHPRLRVLSDVALGGLMAAGANTALIRAGSLAERRRELDALFPEWDPVGRAGSDLSEQLRPPPPDPNAPRGVTPADPHYEDAAPPNAGLTYYQARERAKEQTDEALRAAYRRAMRNMIVEEAEIAGSGSPVRRKYTSGEPSPGAVGTGAASFAKGRLTQAAHRLTAIENELRARGFGVPDPEDAFQDVTPKEIPAVLQEEFGRLGDMEDTEILGRLGEAEDLAGRNPDSVRHVVRRSMLAAEARRRGLDPEAAAEAVPVGAGGIRGEPGDDLPFLEPTGSELTRDQVHEFGKALEQKHGLEDMLVQTTSIGDLRLSDIAVPADARSQGRGSAAMEDLVRFADTHGKRITLTPARRDPRHGTTSRSRLVKFYKRFGFVENKGRAKDFTTSDLMYRDPQPLEAADEVMELGTKPKRSGLRQRIADAIYPEGARERRNARRAAETDELTKVGNRRALERALPAAEADPETAVIVFDANNFKAVNDELGHVAGDAMLREITGALRTAMREAGAGDRVFRYGGDEFVLIAPRDQADAIRARAEELFGEHPIGSKQASISGTVGPTFREADDMLQGAKAARKGTMALAPTPLEPGWAKAQAAARFAAPGSGLKDAAVPKKGTSLSAPRRSAIVKDLSKVLDVPVRVGRSRVLRKAYGFYRVKNESIRLRVANDVEVTAHEVGHHLHKLLFGTTPGGGLSRKVLHPWKDELLPLGEGVSDSSTAEGLAEFVRRYLSNPEAAETAAPRFHAYLEDRLSTEFPQVRAMLLKARENYRLWIEASPQARVRAQVSVNEKPERMGIRDRWDQIRTNVIDDMDVVRRVVDDLTGGAGPKRLEEDAELLARVARGAAGQADHFLERGTLSFGALKANGKALREVLAPVADRIDDFRDYAVARRALELAGRGIRSGISPEDARWTIQQLASDEFRTAFAELQGYNTRLLQYLRDAGVLTNDAVEQIQKMNANYIPFYRVRDDSVRKRAGGRFGHLFSPVKRIKGSGRDIIDPFESIIKNTHLYANLAARQQVSNALGRLARKHGAGKWLEPIEAPKKVTRAEFKEVWEQIFDKFPEDVEVPEELWEQVLLFFRPGDLFGKENVISVVENGRRLWYEVDPDLYAALQGLDYEHTNSVVKALALPARMLRAGATLAPEFLGRNPFRDNLQAFVQSEYGFKPGYDFARGLFHLIKKDDLYWSWKAAGGERAALVDMDRKGLRKGLDDLIQQKGRIPIVTNPIEALRIMSGAMEDATRLGEHLRGLAAEGTTRTGLIRSAGASREASIDFARHGAKTEALRLISAFWNARLQGYDRLFRAFKARPAKTTARALTGITLPSVLLYYANRDDPEYWEIPQWQRDLFWLVKVPAGLVPDFLESEADDSMLAQAGLPAVNRGGHVWLRFPKPFELGLIFGSMPERMLEWMDSKDPQGLKTLGETLAREGGSLVTGAMPWHWTAVEPLVENIANHSFFLDRPIVPRGKEDVAPEYQYTQGTSEVAKGLGRLLGRSPAKIDNVLYGWTAGLGRIAVDAADATGRAVGLFPEEEAQRPTGLADVPGVRGFIARSPGTSSESIDRFYDRLHEATVAKNTADLLRREERLEELASWEAKHRGLLDEYAYLSDIADELRSRRAEIAIVQRDGTLSKEERELELMAIGREMTERARGAIERAIPTDPLQLPGAKEPAYASPPGQVRQDQE